MSNSRRGPLLKYEECPVGDDYVPHSTTFVSILTGSICMGIIFHILTGSCKHSVSEGCKMMFPISCLVYSVNYHVCLQSSWRI